MFGQMQVTRMFPLSKLETEDEAVAKLLKSAEYPKARAYDAPSGRPPPNARGQRGKGPLGQWRRAGLQSTAFCFD